MSVHDSGRQTVYCTCLPLSPCRGGISASAQQLGLLSILLCSALSRPGFAVDPATPAVQSSVPVSQAARGRVSGSESLQRELSAQEDSLTSVELLGKEQQVLALYRQAEGPEVKGAVLMLPDTGQHPDWPLTVRPLREGLAEHGWHTLSMTMSAPKPLEQPERTLPPKNQDGVIPGAAASPDDASDDESEAASLPSPDVIAAGTPVPPEAAVAAEKRSPDDLQRVAIGYQWLDTLEPDKTAIVGIGSRAGVALQAWLDLQLDAGRVALVLVNADFSGERLKEMNAQPERFIEARILDVFDPLDRLSAKLAAGRLRSFERMQATRYSQTKISGLAKETGLLDQRLTRSVRGWLKKRAFSNPDIRPAK